MTDLRYAFRQLAKSPGLTVVAVLTLALGIGANTALFSVINSVLLRPLPFPDASQLTLVWETNRQQGVKREGPSGPNFYDWREQSRLFQDLAAVELGTGTVTGQGDPQQFPAMRVTTNFFSLLNVRPALGRGFTPEDGKGGRQMFVVVSNDFWRSSLRSDPHIVGKKIVVDLIPYEVIGVLDRDFWLPFPCDFFVPWPDGELRSGWRLDHDLGVFGRLKPDVTTAQAEGELNGIHSRLRAAHPELEGWEVTVVPLQTVTAEYIRPVLIVLFCAVTFLLLIACTNVANLLLARAVSRRREIAVRIALGATRSQLLRQFLTESLMLGLAAGAVGILLASWAVPLLSAIVPNTVPIPDASAEIKLRQFRIDGHVLAFNLVVSLFTSVLFGLTPAVHALKTDVIESLKKGAQTASGGGRRIREALLVAEVALSLVLLAGAGLMLKSFSQLKDADLGFRTDHLLTMEMELPTDTRYRQASERSAFFARVLEQAGSLPGVTSVAVTSTLPLHNQDQRARFLIENGPVLPPNERLQSDLRRVSPGYFSTMGIALKHGRLLERRDSPEAKGPLVGVIDEAFARRFFADENPLGRHLVLGKTKVEIVGVVGDVKHGGAGREARPTLYLSFLQMPASRMNLLLRTTAEPTALVPSVRNAVWSVDRDQAIYRIETMEKVVAGATSSSRLMLWLFGLFAVLALGLAAAGIYAVMAYNVGQRTSEMGIRMALGASSADVMQQVLRQGMKTVLIGLAAGLAATFALGRFSQSMLYNTSPHDPLTLIAIAAFLAAVAFIACYLPARRATKVDPLIALRAE